MIQHNLPETTKPARVVVLGASGFVARDLLRTLAQQGIETLPVASSEVDLTAPESVAALQQRLRSEDSLVFVSALTPDRGRDIRTLMRNLSMAEHVCAALETAPCAHVVYISSDAVYHDDANPVSETSCCEPSSFHGLMHFARERMLRHALAKKAPLLILRPSLLFGAEDTHNGYGPNRFARLALQGKTITLFGNGEEQRDHIYIRDVSRLIGLALSRRSEGVLNVATGTSTSFHDAARMVVRLVAREVAVEGTPRQNPITHRHFDITETLKAFPEFSYTPLEPALAETIREMAGAQPG